MNLPGPLIPRFSFICLLLSILIAPGARGEFTHVVKKGESLTAIAREYHLPVSRIREANHLAGSKIVAGKPLVIPMEAPAGQSRTALRKSSTGILKGSPETYAVKRGDTLARIASRFHLRVKELVELNGLQGSRLKSGQVLRLKAEASRLQEVQDGPVLKGDEVGEPGGDPNLPRLERDTPERGPHRLLHAAEKFLGVKYRRGGTSPIYGLDCSGYVQKVFQTIGVDLPRTAREQFGVGLDVARDALRLGDLVFFKRQKDSQPSHVGIYVGDQKFIHASVSKRKVKVDSLETGYFGARFIGAKRIGETEKNTGPNGPAAERLYFWETRFEPPCCPPDFPPLKQD